MARCHQRRLHRRAQLVHSASLYLRQHELRRIETAGAALSRLHRRVDPHSFAAVQPIEHRPANGRLLQRTVQRLLDRRPVPHAHSLRAHHLSMEQDAKHKRHVLDSRRAEMHLPGAVGAVSQQCSIWSECIVPQVRVRFVVDSRIAHYLRCQLLYLPHFNVCRVPPKPTRISAATATAGFPRCAEEIRRLQRQQSGQEQAQCTPPSAQHAERQQHFPRVYGASCHRVFHGMLAGHHRVHRVRRVRVGQLQ
mmetsp:Transcript_70159/g.111610  ORF Transcript_70159/g.111610 Transcript_70159/m.111610 type:complete len:250 (-) Transcript_70159:750-1499(-)